MGFKIYVTNVLILCFLTSCGGLRIGEKYKNPAFTGTKLGCMNKLREQFEAYVQQKLKEGELGVLSRCLTNAFIIFKHHIKGEKKGNYSPEELRNFFHEFFLQDRQISDAFLHHLMVLKVALVGGDADSLTLDEIDQITERVQVLGKIMEDIYPYNHIFFNFNQADTSLVEFNQSIKVIKNTSSTFSHQIFKKPYSLESAGHLLQGISQLMDFSSDQNFLWLRAIKGFAPFVLHSSSQKDVILPKEWPVLIAFLTDISSILLHIKTAFQSNSFSKRMLYHSSSFKAFLKFLENRIDDRPITRSEILRLLRNLKKNNVIPERIRTSSLETMIDVFFGKIIMQKKGDFSFGKKEFLWLKNFYHNWNQLQRDISLFVSDADWQNKVSEENTLIIKELTLFKSLYQSKNKNIDVYLKYSSLEKKDSLYKNLVMNSIYWYITQAVLRGYAKYPEHGLRESEFGNLLKDFKGFVSDLGGFSSAPEVETENYGRLEFIAGHLLLYETDGFYGLVGFWDANNKWVEVLSQREGTEFLSLAGFIIKTLKDLSQKFHEVCSNPIPRDCFISKVLPVLRGISRTMPHFVEFLENLTEEEQVRYAELLFKISVVDPKKTANLEFMESVHLRNLVFALLYQEVTITRYDLNENAVLDKDELKLGGDIHHLYDGLIKYFGVNLFCRDLTAEDIDYIYAYIAKELKLPPAPSDSRMNQLRMFLFNHFKQSLTQMKLWGDLQINRIQLLKMALALAQGVQAKSSEIMSAQCN